MIETNDALIQIILIENIFIAFKFSSTILLRVFKTIKYLKLKENNLKQLFFHFFLIFLMLLNIFIFYYCRMVGRFSWCTTVVALVVLLLFVTTEGLRERSTQVNGQLS